MIAETRYAVTIDFASALSPWWLLAALPLLVGLMAWLYLRQLSGIRRIHRRLLLALRLLTVATVVFLVFRPRLDLERITDYGGRFEVLVDNSLSMGIADQHLNDQRAAAYARRAGALDDRNRFFEAVETLDALRADLAALHRQQEGRFTERDAYWRYLDAHREAVNERLSSLDAFDLDGLQEALEDIRGLYAGTVTDAASTRAATRRRIETLGQFRARMREQEEKPAAAGNQANVMAEAVRTVRGWTRLALVDRLLDQAFLDRCGLQHPRQAFRLRLLHANEAADAARRPDLAAQPGGSNLIRALGDLLREEDPMPLSGVFVVSDGRLNGRHQGADALAEQYRNQGVPVHTLAVGAEEEPEDLAVLRVLAPPFAVRGQTVRLHATFKTRPVDAEPLETLDVRLQAGTAEETTLSLEPGGRTFWSANLDVPVPEAGLMDIAVRIPHAQGELTEANNSVTMPVEVLAQKIRILYLEERPHWQARFVTNVLGRLPYVDLNALVTLTAPEGKLPRGVGAGTWPSDPAILELYDIVILGDVPAETLSEDEWQALLAHVREDGATLMVLAGERHLPAAYAEHPLASVLPFPAPAPVTTESVTTWARTPAGLHNRMVRGWDFLPALGEDAAAPPVAADAVGLLSTTPDSAPLLGWRRVNNGKVLYLAHPALWSRVNSAHLTAHTRLWVETVTWSRRLDLASAEENPGLLAEAYAVPSEGAAYFFGRGQAAPLTLAHAAGNATRTVDGEALLDGLVRYRAPGLQRGRWTAKRAGDTQDIRVFEETPEYGRLSRHPRTLRDLAMGTNALCLDIADAPALLPLLEGKTRTETERTLFPIWRHWLTLLVVAGLIAAEWILRKWVGKI